MKLDARIPAGPLEKKWHHFLLDAKLVNPANKRKFDVIVVGSGLAGASAAASLASLATKSSAFATRQRSSSPQHRRPGRHQRRQELLQRWRQRLPNVLRHD